MSSSAGEGPRVGERWGGWVWFLLACCACLNLYRIGTGSLWDQDETKYAQVAVEILSTGDPITLHVNGRPWYVHPPLYMWLVAATGRFLGFTEFTVRVWTALASVVSVYATVLLSGALFGPRAGLLAGAVLTVTLQYLLQSRLAVFDTALLAWMLLACYAFYRGYQRGRRADYLRFFLFAGLATLTKGPIGLVLPGLVAGLFVTVRRAWNRWREVPWAAGLALYAAVGLAWYAVEALLHGRAFVSSVLGYYTFGRFFGVVEKQAGPWFYYVPVLLFGAFPWTAFWPAASAFHLRHRRQDGSLLVLLWCGVTFVLYSAAGTKLPNYILPFYPFAAIAVAALWDSVLDGQGVGSEIGTSLALLVGLLIALGWGVAVYLGSRYPGPYHALGHVFLLPAGMFALGVGVALVLAARGRAMPAFLVLCGAMAAAWVGAVTWVLPVVESQKPMKPLALSIRGALGPGDRIVGYRMSLHASLIFYTGHAVEWVETPEELRRALCGPGQAFLVARRDDLASLGGALPADLRPFAERQGTAVLVKPASAPCGLAGRPRPRIPGGGSRGSVGRAAARGGVQKSTVELPGDRSDGAWAPPESMAAETT